MVYVIKFIQIKAIGYVHTRTNSKLGIKVHQLDFIYKF